MHMADALLSPEVGIGFLAGSAAVLAVSARALGEKTDDAKVPMMGVLGAFVFAAQMINFTIPATGSSGHIGGGMLLAMLLGPYAAFIVIASVLIIQALLFADGGILALGANIWNLGIYPCFVGWAIFKFIAGKSATPARISIAAVIGAIVALELGAFSVVLQTTLSGRSDLPFRDFLLLMLGIHLPIALIEGFVTIAVINFIYRIRPSLVKESLGMGGGDKDAILSYKPVAIALLVSALLIAGGLSWFASSNPDGLEWSIAKITGSAEGESPPVGLVGDISELQKKNAAMPDYNFKNGSSGAGTGIAGVIGALAVFAAVFAFGILLMKIRKSPAPEKK